MPRPLHSGAATPAAARAQADLHRDTVDEVARAVAEHDVVVVGMTVNTSVKKARRALDEQQIPHTYLEYGGYFGQWRKRLAIKMWAGWPTFPMVFVRGTLVGGNSDLRALIAAGGLRPLLEQADTQ